MPSQIAYWMKDVQQTVEFEYLENQVIIRLTAVKATGTDRKFNHRRLREVQTEKIQRAVLSTGPPVTK